MKSTVFVLASVLLLCGAVRADDPIGLVSSQEGSAVAADAHGNKRPLSLQSEIFLNDIIRTGVAAKLEILFVDETLFSQGEHSEMVIDRYVYNPADKKKNDFGVKLKKGIFRTITGQIPILNRQGFSVETPQSVIGIRGCILGFMIDAETDRIFIVEVDNESIFIEPFTGQPGMVYETACLVTIGTAGELIQEPLTPEAKELIKQATGGSDDPDDGEKDDAEEKKDGDEGKSNGAGDQQSGESNNSHGNSINGDWDIDVFYESFPFIDGETRVTSI